VQCQVGWCHWVPSVARSQRRKFIRSPGIRRHLGAPAGPSCVSRGDRLIWPSPATPARHRRILADDIHWFILVGNLGQTLWAAVVPTRLSSGGLANSQPKASAAGQGFPGSYPTCLISAPHVPHRRTISGPLQISTIKKAYRNFSCTARTAAPRVVAEVASVPASAQSDPCWNRAARRHYIDARADRHRALLLLEVWVCGQISGTARTPRGILAP
jgi:hypothetical protein